MGLRIVGRPVNEFPFTGFHAQLPKLKRLPGMDNEPRKILHYLFGEGPVFAHACNTEPAKATVNGDVTAHDPVHIVSRKQIVMDRTGA
ncbi:hypothetical protein ROS1_52500 [Roseibium sp. ROS1]